MVKKNLEMGIFLLIFDFQFPYKDIAIAGGFLSLKLIRILIIFEY